ncbi:MAG: DUF4249 domain-containing protein [Tannerella sp.]|jgi:hypothetical protein|nr:DUF4249 domain-containing protein [Tannerella sp.]
MLHPFRFFPVLLFLPALLACTAPIELNTNDSEPVIVIYGSLTEHETLQTIRISASSPYFEEKNNRPVSDAVVEIQASDGQAFALEELPEDRGCYRTVQAMAAIPGVSYRLSVEVDFDGDGRTETYGAVTTMLPPFRIDSLTVEPVSLMGYLHYAVNLYASEDPSEDYYMVRYILNDTLMEYQLSTFAVFSDLGINGQYLDGMPLMYFDDISNRNGLISEDSGATFVQSGDKITICISRIEKGFYDFVRQCQSEKRGENPFFGGPASNITTNISQGGVGYFSAYSTVPADIYIP